MYKCIRNVAVLAAIACALTASSCVPLLAQARTTPVTVENTPSVSVGNSPTVKVDSTANAVKTPTQSKTVQLWTTDQSVAGSGSIVSATINTAGYKEMRVYVSSSSSSALVTVDVSGWITVQGGGSQPVQFGTAKFGTPSPGLTNQAGWTQATNTCIFTIPIMLDSMSIRVNNGTGAPETIWRRSYVYLVN